VFWTTVVYSAAFITLSLLSSQQTLARSKVPIPHRLCQAAVAAAATPVVSALQVEDVLGAREWEQYLDMIDELRALLEDSRARSPGSRPHARIAALNAAFSWRTTCKVSKEMAEQMFDSEPVVLVSQLPGGSCRVHRRRPRRSSTCRLLLWRTRCKVI